MPNQKRVHVHIVESGTSAGDDPVQLGACVINGLPGNLPVASPIEVTISYDEQARVHVAARDVASGQIAKTEIVRKENLRQTREIRQTTDIAMVDARNQSGARVSQSGAKPHEVQSTSAVPGHAPPGVGAPPRRAATLPAKLPQKSASAAGVKRLESADRPVPLCNRCGEPLNVRGLCAHCGGRSPAPPAKRRARAAGDATAATKTRRQTSGAAPQPPGKRRDGGAHKIAVPPLNEAEALDLDTTKGRAKKPAVSGEPQPPPAPRELGGSSSAGVRPTPVIRSRPVRTSSGKSLSSHAPRVWLASSADAGLGSARRIEPFNPQACTCTISSTGRRRDCGTDSG